MNLGEVVETMNLDNEENITFRLPQQGDALVMCNYINTLSKEKTFIYYQGEQQSLEDEEVFLQTVLSNIVENKEVYIMALENNKVIGAAQITLQKLAKKHVGLLGISIAREHRGKGIGKKLMEVVITQAKKNLPSLKLIILSVFSDNKIGIEMYKKFGFVEYGKLPNGILHDKTFVDEMQMYKEI